MNEQMTALSGAAEPPVGAKLDLQDVRVRFLGSKGELTAS